MRCITWNVGHQTRRKALPATVAVGLAELAPDIVVLTEYVYDDSHRPFLDMLQDIGVAYWRVSDHVTGQNQVLIASRSPLGFGAIQCTAGLSAATGPNWLHVHTDGLDVVGFRRPMFKAGRRAVAQYWDWVGAAIEPLFAKPTILLGDFNAVPQSAVLQGLLKGGWQLVTPSSGWSFQGKTGQVSAIDHALASPSLSIKNAAYVTEAAGCSFAGAADSYSDHGVLRFEVAPTPAS